MQATLEVLGSGTSHGVPMIGCNCKTCTSNDPKDRRTRTSVLVRLPDSHNVLIDCGPDFRTQALRAKLTHIDDVIFTHDHADHIFGFYDLLVLAKDRPITVHLSARTLRVLRTCFYDVVDHPNVHFHVFDGPFVIHGVTFTPIPAMHGLLPVHGFRFGELAFVTDCNSIPDESIELLRGVPHFIIDALQPAPHSTHFSYSQSLEVIYAVKPGRAYWVHMNHECSHQEIVELLSNTCDDFCSEETRRLVEKSGVPVEPLFDGMEITFNL